MGVAPPTADRLYKGRTAALTRRIRCLDLCAHNLPAGLRTCTFGLICAGTLLRTVVDLSFHCWIAPGLHYDSGGRLWIQLRQKVSLCCRTCGACVDVVVSGSVQVLTASSPCRLETVGRALEDLLGAAQSQDRLTVGVYESAKLMNVDPDSVVLCVLAADEEDEGDIALQIHFTLLQAFCCDNDINILRVSGLRRLAQLLDDTGDGTEPRDLHCILVTNPPVQPLKCPALQDVGSFCQESRCRNQWVPCLELQDR
uniref:Growth arrest and DNA damage inducible beta n=1 Tax=Echeneis naucrates TaxID=173247 RepID=A0A665U990_ECHNA